MGLIADTNMPAEGSPWHKLMEVETPPDWEVFIQPGGMEPNAENLEWLTQTPATLKLAPTDPLRRAQGRTYYERFVRNNSADWCKRYVHAKYGDDPSGTAVFRESFKRSFHVVTGQADEENGQADEENGVMVDALVPVPGYPLVVGLDFGRDPCAIICQPDHQGRLLVLEEIIAEDIGLEMQLQRAIRPALLQERYLGKGVIVVGDPAGRSKNTHYEETSFDLVKANGFNAYPAPTNDIDKRINAVESWLLQQRNGGPAMVIDGDRCPVTVRALNGGYRYAKTKQGVRKPLPDKNEYSHVMDALQYAALACHGGMIGMVSRKLQRPMKTGRVRTGAGGWT